jgi:hypothetical protein
MDSVLAVDDLKRRSSHPVPPDDADDLPGVPLRGVAAFPRSVAFGADAQHRATMTAPMVPTATAMFTAKFQSSRVPPMATGIASL